MMRSLCNQNGMVMVMLIVGVEGAVEVGSILLVDDVVGLVEDESI